MRWAIDLTLSEHEALEKRLLSVMNYILNKDKGSLLYLRDIDATGPKGGDLTRRKNNHKEDLIVGEEEIIQAISEDGQIIELDLLITNSTRFRILVIDGSIVEIIGEKERIPDEITGSYIEVDIHNSYTLN